MQTMKVGDIIKGEITGITEYGLFMSLNNNYAGLVHISEISDFFIKDINDYFKTGETLKVKVLEIDEKKQQAKLSIKQVNSKSKSKKIDLQERGEGFGLLEKNLDKWTKEKLEEMNVK